MERRRLRIRPGGRNRPVRAVPLGGLAGLPWWAGGRWASAFVCGLCYSRWRSSVVMGNIFAIVAFGLLWVFLVVFFAVVFRALIVRDRSGPEGDKDRWEHGL